MAINTRHLRMIVNKYTGERVCTEISNPRYDFSGLPHMGDGPLANPDWIVVKAELSHEAEPVDGDEITSDEEVDPILRENASYILDTAEKAFGLVDCGMSIQGNRVKVLGGRTNPAFVTGDDLPF